MSDRDKKLVAEFDASLAAHVLVVTSVDVRTSKQNAVAERFVQSVKQECVDHFVICGKAHLRHIESEYLLTDARGALCR